MKNDVADDFRKIVALMFLTTTMAGSNISLYLVQRSLNSISCTSLMFDTCITSTPNMLNIFMLKRLAEVSTFEKINTICLPFSPHFAIVRNSPSNGIGV